MNRKQSWFALTDRLLQQIKPGEDLSLGLIGEESLFLRFNREKLRQATHVEQFQVEMIFQASSRKVQFNFSITGNVDADFELALALLSRARQEVLILPADPLINEMKDHGQSDSDHSGELPSEESAIADILKAHGSVDFAGFFAGGPLYRASRNSKGQNHWFSTQGFFYDYSLFTIADVTGENKAVKGHYSEKNWSPAHLKANVQSAVNQLSLLRKPGKKLTPGSYRAYLAPGAVAEILSVLSSAFGYSAYRKGRSPFARLNDGHETLSPLFTFKENFALGLSPRFNSLGEVAPEILPVVVKGELKNWITSSRSAQEYDAPANAAEVSGWMFESLRSPEIESGNLAEKDALQRLGTGVWLGNLHYLNWSDVSQARVTGMTRYACFWVENGEIVAPIQDMRFDESLYRVFGSELEDLTVEQTLEPNISTYARRDPGGKKIPGALLRDFRFTL